MYLANILVIWSLQLFLIQYLVTSRLCCLPLKTFQVKVLAHPSSQIVLLYFPSCVRYHLFWTIRCNFSPHKWEVNEGVSESPNVAYLAHCLGGGGDGTGAEGFFPYFPPLKPRYVLWSGTSYSPKNMVMWISHYAPNRTRVSACGGPPFTPCPVYTTLPQALPRGQEHEFWDQENLELTFSPTTYQPGDHGQREPWLSWKW